MLAYRQVPYSLFDIAGPIMVGPSSSHTAGACKIGQLAQAIFDDKPDKVLFELHGSFATVTQGHATDRALLGGIMKFKTSDPRIKEAFDHAKERKIQYEYKTVDLGPQYHPNTVRITMETEKSERSGKKNKNTVTGSSIGGGIVMICAINNFPVDIRATAGKYKSIIVSHSHASVALEAIVQRLEQEGIKVKEIQTSEFEGHCLTILSLDSHDLKLSKVLEMEKIPGVEFVRSLTQLEHE